MAFPGRRSAPPGGGTTVRRPALGGYGGFSGRKPAQPPPQDRQAVISGDIYTKPTAPPPAPKTPQYQNTGQTPQEKSAWEYWKQQTQQPGYTPEHRQAMDNQAISQANQANQGLTDQMREMYAGQGLLNTGVMNTGIADALVGNSANLQNILNQNQIAAGDADWRGRMGLTPMGLSGSNAMAGMDLGRERLGQQSGQFLDQLGYQQYMNNLYNDYYKQQGAFDQQMMQYLYPEMYRAMNQPGFGPTGGGGYTPTAPGSRLTYGGG